MKLSHTLRSRLSALSLLSASALVTPACIADDDVAAVDEEVVGGTFGSTGEMGTVLISHLNDPRCSGTVVANRWVLTARGCVEDEWNPGAVAPAGNLEVRFAPPALSGPTYDVQEVLVFPSTSITSDGYWTYDVALLHMAQPIPMNGKATGFSRPIYQGLASTMQNKPVTCYGFGTEAGPASPSPVPTRGAFVATSPDGITYGLPVAGGKYIWDGDRGGACFDSTGALTGVHTMVDSANGKDISASVFRTWLRNILHGNTSDFSGDGRADLIWVDPFSGNVVADTLSGTGTSAVSQVIGQQGFSNLLLGTADLNRDDQPDLLWHDLGTNWLSRQLMFHFTSVGQPDILGTNGFGPSNATTLPSGATDLDGDGDNDVVFRDSANGNVHIMFMEGGIDSTSHFHTGLDPSWAIAAVADVDGDGRGELILRHSGGSVYRWNWNGSYLDGGFVNGATPSSWQPAGHGDFNGDGKQDLLFRDGNSGALIEWWMSGNTVLGQQQAGITPSGYSLIKVADVDGDLDDDLVFRQGSSGFVTIWTLHNGVKNAEGGFLRDWWLVPVPSL
jgi:trypsin/VCBS repeat protein